jgi:DNA replication protein DnaC
MPQPQSVPKVQGSPRRQRVRSSPANPSKPSRTSPEALGFHSLGSDAQELRAVVARIRQPSGSSARPNTTTPSSGGGRLALVAEPAPAVCPGCHGAGLFHYDVRPGDPRFGQLYPCECQADRLAAERARKARAASDVAPDREGCGFEDYDPTYNPDALETAREWAMGYGGPGVSQPGYLPFLLLYGGRGTGKTHLLSAAFYALLDAGRSPIYTVAPLLLDHIRDGIGAGDYADRFYAVRDCPLLILDDLGAESRTAWSEEALFKLVDYRYRLKLPLAVATNLAPDELESRISSRLQDRALACVLRMYGPDWRLQGPQGSQGPRGLQVTQQTGGAR